eukprot:364195-Chlamydomonas_euryale.AAC.6
MAGTAARGKISVAHSASRGRMRMAQRDHREHILVLNGTDLAAKATAKARARACVQTARGSRPWHDA